MKIAFLKTRRVLAIILLLAMLCTFVPVQTFAAVENTPKEEVIYVNLNADGTVKEINVVNIFGMDQAGTIVDFGVYDSVRNMTGTSPITQKGNTITLQAEAGKVYYEGKLNSNVIPWNISIRYFLDGKEYAPKDIAGKSGSLTISFDISRNQQYHGTLYDKLALQVSAVLDTTKCSNINAPSATLANVGKNKQITHTILPGKDTHFQITANVVDFSMDGISINGIPLNLTIEVDQDAMLSQFSALRDALIKLDDGAVSLKDGIFTMQESTKNELANGAADLSAGITELKDGVSELQSGSNALHNGAQELQNGATALSEGIDMMHEGIVKMQDALNELNLNSPTLTEGSAAYLNAMKLLQSSLGSISTTQGDISALTNASSAVLNGLTQLVDAATTLEDNISFSALKTLMAKNGLDVDSLQSNNYYAMDQLRAAIDENQFFVSFLQKWGYDVSGLFEQLEQVILLLDANNAFIYGTELYLDTLNSKMNEFAYNAALLQTNYALFDSEINNLVSKLGGMSDNMDALTNAVNTLVSEYQKLDRGVCAYTGAVSEIVSAYSEIVNGSFILSTSSKELESGMSTLRQGTSDLLNGALELYTGAGALEDGSAALNSGVTELVSGIAQLYDGASDFKNGTSTIRNETSDLDVIISNKISEMLADITRDSIPVTSFVSEDNVNIESVQFVIKTASIEEPVQEVAVEAPPRVLTFWQKILKLFGLLKIE